MSREIAARRHPLLTDITVLHLRTELLHRQDERREREIAEAHTKEQQDRRGEDRGALRR